MLGVGAGIPGHDGSCLEPGYFGMDGCLRRAMVGFLEPAHCACAVAHVEVAWEGAWVGVVLGLDCGVDCRADILLEVQGEGLCLVLGELISPAYAHEGRESVNAKLA